MGDIDDTGNYYDSGDTIVEPAEEECDGIDNDGDGLIDEDFDYDGDGLPDCFQCQVDTIDSYYSNRTGSCSISIYGGVDDFDDILDEWSYGPEFDYEIIEDGCVNPRVMDLDNDGLSDIICSGGYSNSVYSLNGLSGDLMWTYYGAADFVVPSVGDYDDDGWVDVAFIDQNGYMIIIDGYSGGAVNAVKSDVRAVPLSVDWDDECGVYGYGEPYIAAYTFSADFDKDGEWDVVTPAGVFSPVSGKMLYEFTVVEDTCQWVNFMRNSFDVGFVEYGDGVGYVFFDGLYDSAGKNIFRTNVAYMDDPNLPQLAGLSLTGFMYIQADMDSDLEFVLHDYRNISVLDSDGRILSAWDTAGNRSRFTVSTGCAGDVNGDGVSEIFLPVSKHFEYMGASVSAYMGAWSVGGALLWSIDIELYGSSSCTVFDFDGDGSDEVVFSDQDYFYIVSGEDVDILYSYKRDWGSSLDRVGQVGVWSMVVDLDGDGSAELINASPFAARGGEPAVRVLSHAEGAFPPGGRIWPWHSWSGVGMHWDGRPQNDQPGSWLYPGRHRGQAQVHVDGSDLQPFVYDSCVAEAEARLSVGIENLGPYGLGGTLLLEALDEAGTVVASHAFLTALEPGYRTETVEWVFSPEAVQQGLTIRVSTDVSPDCNVHNNTLHWTPDDAASQ